MLNIFDKIDSVFKAYPLIGAPILIALAQLVVYFEPIEKKLNPREGETPELSCRLRKILLDYKSRAVSSSNIFHSYLH